MNSFGFIITRHVNSEKTNKYWNHSIMCLRRLYPLIKIIIIDDNSNVNFIKADCDYTNVEIIQSEFKGRGELLPYYYFIKNKFFDNAVILHDSVFFHQRVNFEKLVGMNVIPLWFFNPDKENISNTIRISNKLSNFYSLQKKISFNDVLFGIQHTKWYGCFGVQSYINHNFLIYLENKYKITNLISAVTCRADRCSLERIFGCLFYTENTKIQNPKSLFGNIMTYCKWEYSYEEYENDIKHKKIPKVVKVWTGR